MPKIKNILIFVGLAVILFGGYFIFMGGDKEQPSLVSNTAQMTAEDALSEENSAIARELLGVLLNVKNISLNDSIFSGEAFISLRDSSILLVPDGNEGRPNPFAPIGTDITASASNFNNSATTISPTSNEPTTVQTTTPATSTTTPSANTNEVSGTPTSTTPNPSTSSPAVN